MTDVGNVRLGQEAKIRLPNVDEVLDLGYARHASDDKALEGTDTQRDAKQIVARFMALEPRNDTETAYLLCAQAIALAHGRAISRRKRTWENEIHAAQAQRRLELGHLRQARYQNAYLNLAWSMLAPSILALSGYLVAQVIGPLLPDEITAQTGNRLPSILLGAVFVLVGRTLSFLITDLQRNAIEVQYDARCYEADIAYELGKSEEHKHYRTRLCEAWEQYTGDKYPAAPSYEYVIQGDIKTRQKIEQQRLAFNRTPLWKIRRCAQFFQWALRRRRR